MTSSLSIHRALSEGACKTMSGKGREGNKEGKGTRVETSTTSSLTYPNRRDAVVSATRKGWMA